MTTTPARATTRAREPSPDATAVRHLTSRAMTPLCEQLFGTLFSKSLTERLDCTRLIERNFDLCVFETLEMSTSLEILIICNTYVVICEC